MGAVGAASGSYYYFVFTITPSLSITPFMGARNAQFTATGIGYTPNYTVGLWFGSLSNRIALTRTDASGNFAMYTATVPSSQASGTFVLDAARYNGKTAVQPYGTAWFTVVTASVPSLAIQGVGAIPSGAPGGPLSVAGLGWLTSTSVSLYWGTSSAITSSVLATAPVSGGAFAATVAVPTEVQSTWYLWAADGSLKVKTPYKIAYSPHIGLASTIGAWGITHTLTIPAGGGFAPGETVSLTLKSPRPRFSARAPSSPRPPGASAARASRSRCRRPTSPARTPSRRLG